MLIIDNANKRIANHSEVLITLECIVNINSKHNRTNFQRDILQINKNLLIIAFTGTGSSSFWTWMNTYIFDTKSAFYIVCYFLLIIAFSYFYATIQFNPIEIANNLKKNGGFIPGFRPGKPTSDFILKVINKITLFGALYLAIVAILPIIAGIIIKNTSLAVGGTSVIIVVGVALETVKSLEAQMLMRHYKGFLE